MQSYRQLVNTLMGISNEIYCEFVMLDIIQSIYLSILQQTLDRTPMEDATSANRCP